MARPGLVPGVYFRMLMVGFLQGIGSERGIGWRCRDSILLREFLGYVLAKTPPEHFTLSKTRKRLSLEVHGAVFSWVLEQLRESRLRRGKTVGLDATTGRSMTRGSYSWCRPRGSRRRRARILPRWTTSARRRCRTTTGSICTTRMCESRRWRTAALVRRAAASTLRPLPGPLAACAGAPRHSLSGAPTSDSSVENEMWNS